MSYDLSVGLTLSLKLSFILALITSFISLHKNSGQKEDDEKELEVLSFFHFIGSYIFTFVSTFLFSLFFYFSLLYALLNFLFFYRKQFYIVMVIFLKI